MLGAESERGDPTRLGLLAASINVEVDIRGTGPDAFTLGVCLRWRIWNKVPTIGQMVGSS